MLALTPEQVRRLVPPPKGVVMRQYRGGTEAIMREILRTYQESWQEVAGLAQLFQGLEREDALKAIWAMTRQTVRYIADPMDRQMVKRPARTLHDGYGDCKSYSILIAAVLRNLGIPHVFRFAQYEKPDFQHVYVVAMLGGRRYVLDACLDGFNEEQPASRTLDMNTTTIASLAGPGVRCPQMSPSIGQVADLQRQLLKEVQKARATVLASPQAFGANTQKVLAVLATMERAINTRQVQDVAQVRLAVQAAFGPPAVGFDPISVATAAGTVTEIAGKVWDTLKGIGSALGLDSLFGPGPFSEEVEERYKESMVCLLWLHDPTDTAILYFRNNPPTGGDDRRAQIQKSARWNATSNGRFELAKQYFAGLNIPAYEAVLLALLRSDLPAWKAKREYFDAQLPKHYELSRDQDLRYYLPAFLASMVGMAADNQVSITQLRAELNQAFAWYAQVQAQQAAQTPGGTGQPTPTNPQPGTQTPGAEPAGNGGLLALAIPALLALAS